MELNMSTFEARLSSCPGGRCSQIRRKSHASSRPWLKLGSSCFPEVWRLAFGVLGVHIRIPCIRLLSIPVLLTAPLLAPGCASPNVNPASPRAHTGYLDLYAEFSGELNWDVQRLDAIANGFKRVFYDLNPLEGRILRLAFA